MKMIRGLVVLAPELNMKIALLNLVDYIDEKISDLDDDDPQFRVEDLLEVVVESLVKLHHHVGRDDGEGFVDGETDSTFDVGGDGYNDNPITNDEVEKFKKLLGIISDDESKEENNG
jgi:hypothetical protein